MGLSLPLDKIKDALNAATGWNIDSNDFLKIGERVTNLERLINLKYGLTFEDDSLPARFREESLPEGNSKGEVIDVENMVKLYYQLRGWEGRDGRPTKKKIKELSLD